MNEPLRDASRPAVVSSPPAQAPPRLVPLAALWAVAAAAAGAVVCSWLVVRFGELGSISLWGLGALGGFVARRIMRAPSATVAWLLVAACILVLPISEVSWIHWKTKQGAALSWIECFRLLPTFIDEYTLSALLSALFTFLGAQSAYWQAGRRIRWVAVAED